MNLESRKIVRVLMLHGFTQNGNMFYKRMSAIRKAAAKSCEFVFLDGPVIIQPIDSPLDFDSLERPEAVETVVDPELIPRAWWRASDDRTVYYGLDETLVYVRDFLVKEMANKGPFDVVLGFSQGAAMAALLTALLERPTAYTTVSFIDTETQIPIHPPFKRAIFGSGFRPIDLRLARVLGEEGQRLLGTQTKTLHVIGRADPVVSAKRMKSLTDCCYEDNLRIEEHDGGHFIPSQSNWRAFLANYLSTDDIDLVPSPIGSVANTPTRELVNRL